MSDKSVSNNLFHTICRDSVHYVWEHYRGPLTLSELMARPIPRLMQLTFEQGARYGVNLALADYKVRSANALLPIVEEGLSPDTVKKQRGAK